MQWQWLIGPAVGSIIGYITNDIAVRMMFRPHSEKRLFGWRIPFTPGLIPKERPRIARAIRDVLDQELLSPAVLEEALLSPRVLSQVESAADYALDRLLQEERTPRMLLEGAFGQEAFDAFEARTTRAINLFIMEKLLDSGLEEQIAQIVVDEARSRVSNSTAGISSLFWDDRRSATMRVSLAQVVREMIATHIPPMLDNTMQSMLHDGLDTPVHMIVDRHMDKASDIRTFLIAQYQSIVRSGLSGALEALDIGRILEDKLNALDTQALEALIMRVMRKELRAIVWLGALLGAVMGLINAIIPMLFG